MMVANSFDLWKKDAFFSAAEEVQESADRMESAYRAWIRERRERSVPEELDELSTELQTALGTAKWQLEEFERAVRLSYRHQGDDNSTSIHRQFISAIESQISRVEAALRESFSEGGRQPLRWVHLDEDERDDLAAFLSGTSLNKQSVKEECLEVTSLKTSRQGNHVNRKDTGFNLNTAYNREFSDDNRAPKDVININKDANCVIEIKAEETCGAREDTLCQADRTTNARKIWGSPNFGALRVVIPDEDGQRNSLLQSAEGTPKEKGGKHVFWKQLSGDYPQALGAVNKFNQLFGRVCQIQRQLQSPVHLQNGCSVKVTLALMLTIFLIVPFVLYST
ncbi:Syntaxin/t-SNARE family protein [Quillaja saponaria]|uniref:Syntaxin/t-SNARE family protein n=1 Tax=Quillaja saponaria TaxID=32244 RepID=A0AAD7QDF1_QUISA|nr:Syntaxin/t-SNARE family protein [Quillaja saponaria]KAJ7979469.1 Syntaxin/t-SNARE family protein [Quillaja saponaria]